jgi:CRP-like cAMP-binding protein
MVAEEIKVDASSRLFGIGERASRLFLLVMGKVSLAGDGSSLQVEQAALDLCSVFAQRPHSVSAHTVEPCVLLVVSYDNLVDLMEAEAEFSWAMARYLARRLRAQQVSITDSKVSKVVL